MQNALLKRLAQEMDVVVRLRDVTEDQLVTAVIGWMDYQYHGVVDMFDPPVTPDFVQEIVEDERTGT